MPVYWVHILISKVNTDCLIIMIRSQRNPKETPIYNSLGKLCSVSPQEHSLSNQSIKNILALFIQGIKHPYPDISYTCDPFY